MSFYTDPSLDPDDAFEMPAGPPQLESESNKTIQQLLDEAPAFDQAYLPEMVILLRNHIVLRTMFMMALEHARIAELKLRTLDDPNEMFRAQGEIRGLTKYVETLQGLLTSTEEYRGTNDPQ